MTDVLQLLSSVPCYSACSAAYVCTNSCFRAVCRFLFQSNTYNVLYTGKSNACDIHTLLVYLTILLHLLCVCIYSR